jgi:hypothetical protein
MKRNLITFTVLAAGVFVLWVACISRTTAPKNSAPVVLNVIKGAPREAVPRETPSPRAEIEKIALQPSPKPMTESSLKPNNRLPNLIEAEPFKAKGLASSIDWLGVNEAARFPFAQFRSKAVRFSPPESWKPHTIASREEAVAHLNVSLSMVVKPSVGFEDSEFFYFSGGNTAYPVKDFSNGISISKDTGEISAW